MTLIIKLGPKKQLKITSQPIHPIKLTITCKFNHSVSTQMVISIQHGLLESANYPGNRKSAVIFNNEIALTTANILEPYLINNSIFTHSEIDLITGGLRRNEIIETENYKCLEEIKFNIVFDRAKIPDRTKYLIKYEAKLLYLFNSNGVHACVSSIVDKLIGNSKTDDINTETSDIQKILLSSIIILRIVKDGKSSDFNFETFLKSMTAYIQFLQPPSKLNDVLTLSTPFGLENFYKTVNFGKVANVLGRNNCIFLLSNLLMEGCEGSAVFNNVLRLIGIVIFTTFPRKGGDAQFTLAASFQYIFKDFLYQLGRTKKNIFRFWKYSPPEWEKSMILIRNIGGQGTGIFTKLFGKKYILTCSHVVHEVEKTACRYSDGSIECDVVWKNPNFDEPYDVALLEAPSFIPDSYFVKISNKRPRLGQLIYNAGFPNLTNIKDESFYPSIFEGRIIKCLPGCIMSDASLQAGQSGGPMLDENGDLVGVCVCNIKVDNKIYPQINIAVPVWEIRTTLEQYAKTHNAEILNNLIAAPAIKRVWGLERPLIESKL